MFIIDFLMMNLFFAYFPYSLNQIFKIKCTEGWKRQFVSIVHFNYLNTFTWLST